MNQTTFSDHAAELAAQTIGARVKFHWFGRTRQLDSDQYNTIGQTFGADVDYLSASKKLLNNKVPEFRAVSAVRGKILKYWKNNTLPHVETGVRLLRRTEVQTFAAQMAEFSAELETAVSELDSVYWELKNEARNRLGDLFDETDYPSTLLGSFSVSFDFPNLSAPDYLAELSPELFSQEQSRIRAQFERSIELAEQAFLTELAAMVERITATLSGTDDGKPKIFRDSMIGNLRDFFERFKVLNIGSSSELESIINDAENAIAGVSPSHLRESSFLRDEISNKMKAIGETIANSAINRPARKIQFSKAG